MEIVFWVLAGFSIYSYVLFPIALVVLSRIAHRPWKKEEDEPTVSMVVSAHNEEKVIADKMENALALDYPREKLEIMVVSDGSTDSTEQIVREFATRDSRIVLKAFRERSGKTECLNRVVPDIKGDIIFFTDANSMFPTDIPRKLVRNFVDPQVGLVTGWTRYGNIQDAEDTTGIYSRFERWTKIRESMVSSCVGADGAIFAIRKGLYHTLREDDINDFVIPLNVIKQGKRVVIDPRVFCFERPADETGQEYQRQLRITTRTLRAIGRNIQFLNPLRYGSFAFFLFSHKLMRFLVPIFLIGTLVSNVLLLVTSWSYVLTLVGQATLGVLALANHKGVAKGKFASIARFFVLTVTAQLMGWVNMIAGKSFTVWNPRH